MDQMTHEKEPYRYAPQVEWQIRYYIDLKYI